MAINFVVETEYDFATVNHNFIYYTDAFQQWQVDKGNPETKQSTLMMNGKVFKTYVRAIGGKHA